MVIYFEGLRNYIHSFMYFSLSGANKGDEKGE